MIRNKSADRQPIPPADKQPTSSASERLPDINRRLNNRWNQVDLDYFDSHLDAAVYRKAELVILKKDIYYQNVVLFI